MVLPGQGRPASDSLLGAMAEVQRRISRPIGIYDVTAHPNPTVRQARGHHDWDDEQERIWLNPNLSYEVQEAVAAHELAHVLQKAEGYCQTASQRNKNGQPVMPEINLLGRSINSLVMDVMADRWAAQRGFDIEGELRSDALPKALGDVKRRNVGEQEAVDWNRYYSTLRNLAESIASGESIHGPLVLPAEVRTQIRAVGYANLRLRLSPYNLFEDLDSLWMTYWPRARELGIEIAALVERVGTGDRGLCEKAIIAVVEFLNIPPELIVVRRPDTQEIVWPE